MDPKRRIEQGLERALAYACGLEKPAKLAGAMRHAVFPGGARVRPRLCLAVSHACGNGDPAAAEAAATAIELLHCASLVHDDMPVFDDARTRRGQLSVHAKFGSPIALLTGDALIVLAFETIARECATRPALIAPLIATVGRAVGMPHGIVAGQAWESETEISLVDYHRAKTASLFSGSTAAGAIAAGSDPLPWLGLGEALGAAYQVADDLRDSTAEEADMGKPAGQDAAHGRPNSVQEIGISGSLGRLRSLVDAAVGSIPECRGRDELEKLILGEAKRLVPAKFAQSAA